MQSGPQFARVERGVWHGIASTRPGYLDDPHFVVVKALCGREFVTKRVNLASDAGGYDRCKRCP